MTWGFFTIPHISSLLIAVGIIIGLYYLLKVMPRKLQWTLMFILSFAGISAIIFNLVTWNSPLEYLPLHMCSINAMLLPFAVLTRNKTICNLLVVWCLGALVALILNQSVMATEVLSPVFNFYYFPHIIEFALPIFLFKFKYVKLDYKSIPVTIVITMIIYTGIHFANIVINNYCLENNILDYAGNVVQVNYMFSVSPDNPLLQIFYSIIPFDYWYMYLIIPILVVYLLIVYGPSIRREYLRNR